MSLSITILGSNSAVPSVNRWTSSQYIKVNGSGLLFDCGEGTQIKLQLYNIKINSIDRIFITHLHGDHFFGLAGLISTFHLSGRKKPLEVYGPKELENIITLQLKVSETILCYPLTFHSVDPNKTYTIYSGKDYKVVSFPLDHRISTTGFLIKVKPLGKKHSEKSYAYCTDTKYKPDIVDIIKDVDAIYHEATFLSELQHQADDKFHSTAKEAALIAKGANANLLIIGHFSKRYPNPEVLLEEATSIFNNTMLAQDGTIIEL